jgi:hypothetical protein
MLLPAQDSALSLYERLAREGGDDVRLLDALQLRAQHDAVSMDVLREGVQRAEAAGAAAPSPLDGALEVGRNRVSAFSVLDHCLIPDLDCRAVARGSEHCDPRLRRLP